MRRVRFGLGTTVLLLAGAALFAVGAVVLWWQENPPSVHLTVTGNSAVVRSTKVGAVFLEVGPTAAYGLYTPLAGPAPTLHFALEGLVPGRAYHVRAVSTDGHTSADVVVPAAPLPGTHTLRIVGDHFELDGRPWIPRFSWGACAADYAAEAAVGIDAFMSSNCGDSPAVQASAAGPLGAVVVPAIDQADPSLPTTVATYLQDEPDLTDVPPSVLASKRDAYPAAAGLPILQTFSHLAWSASDGPRRALYDAYIGLASAVGIDVYPIWNTGDPGQVAQVAAAQQTLQGMAAGRPTFQWIEAIARPGSTVTPSPQAIEAEAWLAIVNGARGLGWWTFGASPFAAEPPALGALRRVDAALDAFAPALVAPPVPVSLSDPTVNAFATQLDGAVYVFAVNSSVTAPVTERFTVAGRVVTDTLPPLAWRIYSAPPVAAAPLTRVR
jgi:hypothetical protein